MRAFLIVATVAFQLLAGPAYATKSASQDAAAPGVKHVAEGDAGGAVAAYEKAVELDPTDLAAREGLISFYLMAPAMLGGGMDKAREQAAAIRKLNTVRGHVAFGQILQAEKNNPDAATEFEAALRSAPADDTALFQIGRTAALSGQRLERGRETLQRCLALPPPAGAPGHDAAHWRLGNIDEKGGDQAGARAAYEASIKVNPGFQQAIDAIKKLD